MKVDLKRLDVRNIVLTSVAIFIALLLPNLSLAGVADIVKSELDDRDVLSPFEKKGVADTRSSESSSTHGSGNNPASNTDSGSSEGHKGPVKTDLYSQMERYTEYYNKGIDDVPDVVKKVAGNDVILLDISMNDGTVLKMKARTKDGMIVEFRKLSSGEDIDPSVTFTSDEGTIRAIFKSEDPLGHFAESLNQGSVDVKCKGFMKNAALSALKALA